MSTSQNDEITPNCDEVCPNQMMRAVIFDLDGTLIDTAGDLAAAMNHVLTSRGHTPIPHRQVRHLVGFGAKAMIKAGFELSAKTVPAEEILIQMVDEFVDYYRANIEDYSRPFEGMVEAISFLRENGFLVGVCTNKKEALARHLLEALSLADSFDAIVGGDSAGVAKPDPAPVFLCLEQMGISEAAIKEGRVRAVFVGDSDTDIRAATACKMPCLVADFGYGPVDLLEDFNQENRVASFDSFHGLPELITDMLATIALPRSQN